MMNLKTKVLVVLLLSNFPLHLQAQNSWGYGMWGAGHGCPYSTPTANTNMNLPDEFSEYTQAIKELKSEFNDLQQQLKDSKEDSDYYWKLFSSFLKDGYTDKIKIHISELKKCDESESTAQEERPNDERRNERQRPRPEGPPNFSQSNNGAENRPHPSKIENSTPEKDTPSKWTNEEWQNVCDAKTPGAIYASKICAAKFMTSRYSEDISECQKSLREFRDSLQKQKKLSHEVSGKEREIKQQERELKIAKREAQREKGDNQTSMSSSTRFEADCLECRLRGNGYTSSTQQNSNIQSIGYLGMGLTNMNTSSLPFNTQIGCLNGGNNSMMMNGANNSMMMNGANNSMMMNGVNNSMMMNGANNSMMMNGGINFPNVSNQNYINMPYANSGYSLGFNSAGNSGGYYRGYSMPQSANTQNSVQYSDQLQLQMQSILSRLQQIQGSSYGSGGYNNSTANGMGLGFSFGFGGGMNFK